MGFETPKFNKKPEKIKTPEKKEREMPGPEAEKMLGEMDEYTLGLKTLLAEKQTEFNDLQKSEKSNTQKLEALKLEIQELEEQISGLTEFSEEGKEEGAEFTIKE